MIRNIVETQWLRIPRRFPHVSLDAYVIMPNHFHGIVIVGATLVVAPLESKRAGARPAPTLGDIIGSFKSQCMRDWLRYVKRNNITGSAKFWQRNYYEHIIRNENELNEIRKYIFENPLKWHLDPENPESGVWRHP
jgi:REP element-mobilizing transposase RayT